MEGQKRSNNTPPRAVLEWSWANLVPSVSHVPARPEREDEGPWEPGWSAVGTISSPESLQLHRQWMVAGRDSGKSKAFQPAWCSIILCFVLVLRNSLIFDLFIDLSRIPSDRYCMASAASCQVFYVFYSSLLHQHSSRRRQEMLRRFNL